MGNRVCAPLGAPSRRLGRSGTARPVERITGAVVGPPLHDLDGLYGVVAPKMFWSKAPRNGHVSGPAAVSVLDLRSPSTGRRRRHRPHAGRCRTTFRQSVKVPYENPHRADVEVVAAEGHRTTAELLQLGSLVTSRVACGDHVSVAAEPDAAKASSEGTVLLSAQLPSDASGLGRGRSGYPADKRACWHRPRCPGSAGVPPGLADRRSAVGVRAGSALSRKSRSPIGY
jgi:hypothetical protein